MNSSSVFRGAKLKKLEGLKSFLQIKYEQKIISNPTSKIDSGAGNDY